MTPSNGAEIAANLHNLLRKRKVKLTTVAAQTGIPYRTLQNYLYGRTEFPVSAYAAVCEAASIPFEIPIKGGVKLAGHALSVALDRVLGDLLPRLSEKDSYLGFEQGPVSDHPARRVSAQALAAAVGGLYELTIENEVERPLAED